MSLQVIERQTTTQWYELSGDLEARELFPRLLPNSKSVTENASEPEIKTEPEEVEGGYDGFPQDDAEMEGEIAEFTKSALAEFHDEALAAAKATLTALQGGQTLLHEDFEDEEEVVLGEAAKALGIAIPWDPAEAAQMAAAQAAAEVRHQQWLEEEKLRQAAEELSRKATEQVLEQATQLFKAGTSHAAVRARFPNFANEIGGLVGRLRSQGVRIAVA
jgi:hypothetical protein